MGFEDIEVDDDDIGEEIQCSFCGGCFDITCLCCHISKQHPVEAKNGICPICATRVEADMVSHITSHYGNKFKMQRKRKSSRGGSISKLPFSWLRRELRKGTLQSYIISSTNVAPAPLLSSFISPIGDDLKINLAKSSIEPAIVNKTTITNLPKRKSKSLSCKSMEDSRRRCEFVQEMLFATIVDDTQTRLNPINGR